LGAALESECENMHMMCTHTAEAVENPLSSPIRSRPAPAENKGNNNQLPSSERSGSADAAEKKEATWEYIRVVNMAEYDTLIDLTTVRSLTHMVTGIQQRVGQHRVIN
jgi:hypothetical protein